MNLPNCDNFVTRDEFNQLVTRVNSLTTKINEIEFNLFALIDRFNSHIIEDIYTGHNFYPQIFHTLSINAENQLSLDINFDGFESFGNFVQLPNQQIDTISLDIEKTNKDEYIFNLTIGNQQDNAILNLAPDNQDPNEIDIDFNNVFDINLDLNLSNQLSLSLSANGTGIDSTSVNLPIQEHIPSNLAASLSFRNDVLTLSIADGESQDTAQTIIPIAASTQTIFITEEVYMNADELEEKIDDCCTILLNRIGVLETYLVAEIEETESNLNNEINDVKEYVTIDISDTAKTQYECIFPFDENGEAIPTYAESVVTEITYSGKGLTGIHEQLKLISDNLDFIHSDVCKAVDPVQTITLKDMYNFCDNSGIKREDYSEDAEGEARYNEDLNAYFFELQRQSKYGYLINNPDDNIITSDNSVLIKLIEAPTNWTNYIISDFSLIQSRINRNEICNINIENEPTEVITIVASDKVLGKATGDFLNFHLVTFNNYPKRSRNSTYWEFQIPEAKDNYTWDDFVNLVWSRGNLYAELYFEEIRDPVSGWFADKNAADSWFNSILPFTNALERTRKYHEQSNPKRTIQSNIVRPYRAFITTIDSQGNGICKRKYVPVIENE